MFIFNKGGKPTLYISLCIGSHFSDIFWHFNTNIFTFSFTHVQNSLDYWLLTHCREIIVFLCQFTPLPNIASLIYTYRCAHVAHGLREKMERDGNRLRGRKVVLVVSAFDLPGMRLINQLSLVVRLGTSRTNPTNSTLKFNGLQIILI